MLAMLSLAWLLERRQALRLILVYMAIYLIMNIGTFACILCMRRDGRMVEGIADLAGLSKSQPMMALALCIFMFSMAGIPPLLGFLGQVVRLRCSIGRRIDLACYHRSSVFRGWCVLLYPHHQDHVLR